MVGKYTQNLNFKPIFPSLIKKQSLTLSRIVIGIANLCDVQTQDRSFLSVPRRSFSYTVSLGINNYCSNFSEEIATSREHEEIAQQERN